MITCCVCGVDNVPSLLQNYSAVLVLQTYIAFEIQQVLNTTVKSTTLKLSPENLAYKT